MAAKKKKTAKKATKKPAKVKKAPWIREYLAKHPQANDQEVIAAGAKEGLKITKFDYTGVKYKKGNKAKTTGRGRPKSIASSTDPISAAIRTAVIGALQEVIDTLSR
jgi:hypothetical protein